MTRNILEIETVKVEDRQVVLQCGQPIAIPGVEYNVVQRSRYFVENCSIISVLSDVIAITYFVSLSILNCIAEKQADIFNKNLLLCILIPVFLTFCCMVNEHHTKKAGYTRLAIPGVEYNVVQRSRYFLENCSIISVLSDVIATTYFVSLSILNCIAEKYIFNKNLLICILIPVFLIFCCMVNERHLYIFIRQMAVMLQLYYAQRYALQLKLDNTALAENSRPIMTAQTYY